LFAPEKSFSSGHTFTNSATFWVKFVYSVFEGNHHAFKNPDPLRVYAFAHHIVQKFPSDYAFKCAYPFRFTAHGRFIFSAEYHSLSSSPLFSLHKTEVESVLYSDLSEFDIQYLSSDQVGPSSTYQRGKIQDLSDLSDPWVKSLGLDLIEMPPKKSSRQTQRRARKGTSNLAARLANVEKKIRNDVSFNPKWINPNAAILNTGIVNTGPHIQCLNAVGQGTSENTRIGAKLKMRRLVMDIELATSATAQQDTNCAYRIYIVVESSCLGSAIAPSQFLNDTNPQPWSQRNYTSRNSHRFRVLYDSHICHIGALQSALASPFANLSIPSSRSHHIDLNLGNMMTDYSRANAGTVADIDTNSIHLLIVTDGTIANTLVASGAHALEFIDV